MPLQLKNIENLLYRLITAPSGVAEGLATERELPAGGLAGIVRGDEPLSAEDRVDIYANMYFYRLLEVLGEDFPATAAVLGETRFHNLITGYFIEYPPREPSVLWAGRYLPDFLRDHPLRSEFPYVADLAMLERTLIDMFCAPDAIPLEASEMGAIPPQRWARLTMRRIPATALLNLEWKVTDIAHAVDEKREWEPPAREANRVLVWRRNCRVSFRELSDREADALAMLTRATSFGAVCETLSRDLSDEHAPVEITTTLAQWLADGVLIRAGRSRPR